MVNIKKKNDINQTNFTIHMIYIHAKNVGEVDNNDISIHPVCALYLEGKKAI